MRKFKHKDTVKNIRDSQAQWFTPVLQYSRSIGWRVTISRTA
jgi:hypothetical protein